VCHVRRGYDRGIDVGQHLLKVISDLKGGNLGQISSDSELLVTRGGCDRMGIDAVN
jgi:hypothetical protein